RGFALAEKAVKREISDEFLKEELGALGGTSLALRSFVVEREPGRPGIFYPHKELKEIRRALTAEVEALKAKNRVERPDGPIAQTAEILDWLEGTRVPSRGEAC